MTGVPTFAVVPGVQVQRILDGREKTVLELVEAAYRAHGAGRTVNPPSYFLRFPDRPSARIIALPASLGGGGAGSGVDGIKWISSFPDNVASGLPRASAVLVLNDPATGYPLAVLESSVINAARTAGSAALAADRLSQGRVRPRAAGHRRGRADRPIHPHLPGPYGLVLRRGRRARPVGRVGGRVRRLSGAVRCHGNTMYEDPWPDPRQRPGRVRHHRRHPAHHRPGRFAHNPLVLHVSLRDLAPEILLGATNIVDDVEHCLKADTSPHLAEQLVGQPAVRGRHAGRRAGRAGRPEPRTGR